MNDEPANTLPDEPGTSVALVTLGCARNEVDSEELAARLAGDGYRLVEDPAQAQAVLVNTCGFVEAAKKDSVDELLAAADLKGDGQPTRAVIAVGCMAERYGEQLAEALPEADAVLGFDDYPVIADRVRAVLRGEAYTPHTPRDRRRLLPITPAERGAAVAETVVPGHGWLPSATAGTSAAASTGIGAVGRRRLGSGPYAPLKLASGCDRRCTFCAIPRWRGAFVSRPPEEIVAEASWLAEQGVRELFLVSENTTSYGKDLGDLRLLERSLLGDLAAVEGVERVRASYLQPAELRPGLLEAIADSPGVVPYFDLSFQHASPTVLRRMRRFGGTEEFLGLVERIRARRPEAGIRSNVIVGFPGETEEEFEELCTFLEAARLDVVGVFGYSDEEDTAAQAYDGKLEPEEISERVARISALADELVAQRAEDRIGETVEVLVERVEAELAGEAYVEGRAAHQGPEADGSTRLITPERRAPDASTPPADGLRIGSIVRATVVDSDGADLIATPLP